jgi:hypothetical protein
MREMIGRNGHAGKHFRRNALIEGVRRIEHALTGLGMTKFAEVLATSWTGTAKRCPIRFRCECQCPCDQGEDIDHWPFIERVR